MLYIKRNSSGNIVAVSEEALPDFEPIEAPTEELQQFLDAKRGSGELEQTDQGFIRVVEDVIELLIAKNIILFTELPAVAQDKMLRRQRLRSNNDSSLNLLSDDEF